MRRVLATLVATAAAVAALPHAAGAQNGVIGWDGKNPFACTLQQLGGGTAFPEPNADPFCVEYDKRHQNVDKLGVVDFLSKEPARVAAAGPKCFYFQRDHWVGTLIEGNQQTQTYAWDGSYFYDKAKGRGGAYVENLSFNGQTGDPTQVPGFPSEYKPYFGDGRGGVQSDDQVPVDPSCVAKAKKHNPYATGGPGGGGGAGGMDHCRVPGGRVERGIGGIRLGDRRWRVRRRLGMATTERLRWVNYCMTGGGRVTARFGRAGSRGRVLLVQTDAPPFDLHGIRVGQRNTSIRRKLRHFHRRGRARGVVVRMRRQRKQMLIVGTRLGRVKYLATASRKVSPRRAKTLLREIRR